MMRANGEDDVVEAAVYVAHEEDHGVGAQTR